MITRRWLARERLAKRDTRDQPLIDYWRRLIPEDFQDDDAKLLSLNFELSGIERGMKR